MQAGGIELCHSTVQIVSTLPEKNDLEWIIDSVAASDLKHQIETKAVQQLPSIFTHQKRSFFAISLAVMKVHWQ